MDTPRIAANDLARRRLAGSVLLVLAGLIAAPLRAADAAADADTAQIDAIVRKLESSGALDRAIDRAIERYVQRREQARQAEEVQKQAELKDKAKLARPLDLKQDHIRGTPSAEVSLIEYSDFECPFCKQFHGTPKALLERYGERVNWVLRNYPLPFHDPAARTEALAAECVARLAGNEAYWSYADALFANTKSNGSGLPPDKSVEALAQAAGVKAPALTTCMTDQAIVARIEQDIADGSAAGATGTPTTVVRNNRTGASEAVVGARPAEAFVPIIDRLLGSRP